MKICIISPLFDTFGGAEKYIITLAKELVRNHDVYVITTFSSSNKSQYYHAFKIRIKEIRPKNFDTIYNMMKNKSRHTVTLKKMLWHFCDIWNYSSYIQIKKLLVEEKPDLVYINGIKGISSSAFSIVKKSRIPNIYMIHDFELVSRWSSLFRNGEIIKHFNVLDRLYLNYMRRATRGITTVISPSKFMMDFHVNLGFFEKSNRYIVPNGMRFNNKSNIKNNETNFLFIGQIEEHKGPQIAVKAFKRLKNEKIKLHLVGKGNYLGELKKIIGNDERILLHGFVPDDKLEEIFERCSYVIFPSIWYENFPLVIFEAMNRGLPVIASNLGGLPELIKDGYNGFLFRPGDVACLQNIMEKISEDREMLSRFSRNAIESSKRFSLETQMESIMNIFSKTVSPSR